MNCRFYIAAARIFQLSAALLVMLISTLSPSTGIAQPFSKDDLFKIEITGVEGELRENIEAMLVVPHGMVRDGRIEPTWARRYARQAKNRIARAMEPFGYYQSHTFVELKRLENGHYILQTKITPGEPVVVDQQDLSISGAGRDEPRLVQLLSSFSPRKGESLHHKRYEESKGTLLETAISLGYLKAHFPVHDVQVLQRQKTAKIKLQLDTGPRYHFGDIRFLGAATLPGKVLRRYLTFKRGDIYNASELARTQANLLDSDRFRNSQVNALIEQASNHRVPVNVQLTPLPRFLLKPGVGYGTDTGPRVSLRFKDNNTFSLGHEIYSDLMVAELRQTASASYLVPLADKADSIMGFSLQFDREENDTFATRSLAAEFSLNHGFIKGLDTTFFVRLAREDYEIGGESSQSTTLVMPGTRIGQRRWRFDQPGRVRKGYSWKVEIRGASTALGSDVSILQGIVGGSAVLRLSDKSKLIVRGESGTTIQSDFENLPPSMRFFAGGDQSVRGYAYKTLGPKDARGDTVGGRHMLVGSVEVEYMINRDWGLGLFYDTGNAFDSFNDYVLAHGAGVGARRYTPIGPIKVDLASQLGRGNNSLRLHLSVGFGW